MATKKAEPTPPKRAHRSKKPEVLTPEDVDAAELAQGAAGKADEDEDEPEDKPKRKRGKAKAKKVLSTIAIPRELVDIAGEAPLQLANFAGLLATSKRPSGPIAIAELYDPKLKAFTLDVAAQAIGLIELPIGWALLVCYLGTIASGIIGAVALSKLSSAPPEALAMLQTLIKMQQGGGLKNGVGPAATPTDGQPGGSAANPP